MSKAKYLITDTAALSAGKKPNSAAVYSRTDLERRQEAARRAGVTLKVEKAR